MDREKVMSIIFKKPKILSEMQRHFAVQSDNYQREVILLRICIRLYSILSFLDSWFPVQNFTNWIGLNCTKILSLYSNSFELAERRDIFCKIFRTSDKKSGNSLSIDRYFMSVGKKKLTELFLLTACTCKNKKCTSSKNMIGHFLTALIQICY